MANLKEVRTRIASVSSTQQVTSAMKMVSAAKFRRAQNAIFGMRPYATQLSDIIAEIPVDEEIHTPYHTTRKVERVLLVVVASNKGLCGAFNANVLKAATSRIDQYADKQVDIITLGKRATEQFAKRGLLRASYDELLDNPTFDAVAALADTIMSDFCNKRYDRVEIIYNLFKNSLTQILTNEQFLPVAPANAKPDKNTTHADYLFEPSKEDILRTMVPLSLRSQFYRIILDSVASEHGARMTAMQKATDNASELLKELRISYNKARQASITNEIIEIVSGSEALNN
ncbi:MAG: ATP synthase F1 subunit gamma [Bacteroidales bacterium]|nr:ATP synthase F1 subunit gamma [Candidatus Colimorpha onthohippi]